MGAGTWGPCFCLGIVRFTLWQRTPEFCGQHTGVNGRKRPSGFTLQRLGPSLTNKQLIYPGRKGIVFFFFLSYFRNALERATGRDILDALVGLPSSLLSPIWPVLISLSHMASAGQGQSHGARSSILASDTTPVCSVRHQLLSQGPRSEAEQLVFGLALMCACFGNCKLQINFLCHNTKNHTPTSN